MIIATKKNMDIYVCETCGGLYVNETAANNCCKQYRCEVCGVETPPFRLKCEACSEKARFEKARKMTIEEYQKEFPDFMIFHDDDYFGSVEELLEAYTWGDRGELDKMPDYCYGTYQIHMRLRSDRILEEIEEDFDCEDVGYSEEAYREFAEFAKQFNDKYEQHGYYVDNKIVILIPPELKEQYKKEFQNG